jgi:hypothetical protein
LHITFALRGGGELIRVISARDMHRKERLIYEKAANARDVPYQSLIKVWLQEKVQDS